MAKTQTEKVKAENEDLDRAYNRVFSTKAGKKVLEDLAKYCCVHTSTYEGNAEDMLIREGCRRVFLKIAQRIRMDMTEFYRKQEALPTESE